MHIFVLELLEKNMAKHPKFKETLVRDGIDLQNLWPNYVHDGRPRAIEFGQVAHNGSCRKEKHVIDEYLVGEEEPNFRFL